MPKIDIEQGTHEWLALRRHCVTATDIACLMGVGFDTPYQRWMKKVSEFEEPVNVDMQRGKDLEPLVRSLAERRFNTSFIPETHVHSEKPWALASLDGLSPTGLLIEIKCPRFKGHSIAVMGIIPEYYFPQVQWQMYVVGVKSMQFLSYFEGDLVSVEVHRDDLYLQEVIRQAEEFHDCIVNLRAPELTDKDVKEIVMDEGFESAVTAWKWANDKLKEWERIEKEERSRLQEYAKNGSVRGCGVRVMKLIRQGNVDYSSIPELKNVDLNKYRKKPSEYFRISLE